MLIQAFSDKIRLENKWIGLFIMDPRAIYKFIQIDHELTITSVSRPDPNWKMTETGGIEQP